MFWLLKFKIVVFFLTFLQFYPVAEDAGTLNFTRQIIVSGNGIDDDIKLLPGEKLLRYTTQQQIAAIAFLLLLVALGLINYKRYRDKRRHVIEMATKNKKIDRQFNMLKQTNKQNELLLREIHHRVKNNLQMAASLLNMQLRTSESKDAISALRESAGRLQSMLLVHQELYGQHGLATVSMPGYVRNLTDYLVQSYALNEYEVTPHISVSDAIKLKADTATPIGLILTEMITNSLKYARPTEGMIDITIDLSEGGDGMFELAYRDNGPGLPEEVDLERSKTMGLRLLRDLTRQLKGTLTYKNNQGSFFKINFNDF